MPSQRVASPSGHGSSSPAGERESGGETPEPPRWGGEESEKAKRLLLLAFCSLGASMKTNYKLTGSSSDR